MPHEWVPISNAIRASKTKELLYTYIPPLKFSVISLTISFDFNEWNTEVTEKQLLSKYNFKTYKKNLNNLIRTHIILESLFYWVTGR